MNGFHRISIIFSLFFIYLCSGLLFSQSLENITGWQLQNPNPSWLFYRMHFSHGNRISVGTIDSQKGEIGSATGTYILEGNTLKITFDGGEPFEMNIKWINQDEFICGEDIFAASGSNYDLFLKRNMNTGTYGGNLYDGGSSYNNYSTPNQGSRTCLTCHGNGYCPICKGSKQMSEFGLKLHDCTACGGTGKCWHCKGSGLQ